MTAIASALEYAYKGIMNSVLQTSSAVNLTIIPRVRDGYEMVDSQRGVYCRVGYNRLISNKRK